MMMATIILCRVMCVCRWSEIVVQESRLALYRRERTLAKSVADMVDIDVLDGRNLPQTLESGRDSETLLDKRVAPLAVYVVAGMVTGHEHEGHKKHRTGLLGLQACYDIIEGRITLDRCDMEPGI